MRASNNAMASSSNVNALYTTMNRATLITLESSGVYESGECQPRFSADRPITAIAHTRAQSYSFTLLR